MFHVEHRGELDALAASMVAPWRHLGAQSECSTWNNSVGTQALLWRYVLRVMFHVEHHAEPESVIAMSWRHCQGDFAQLFHVEQFG